jgi:hypothetical protein
MLLEHSTDQQFARRLAERYGDGKHTFVHDPPFAWHPEERIPYSPLATNGCGDHQYVPATVNGYSVDQCTRCPWHTIPDRRVFEELVNVAKVPGLRFDPQEWEIRVERVC